MMTKKREGLPYDDTKKEPIPLMTQGKERAPSLDDTKKRKSPSP
jgi:hypothetical protein